jgi:tryptophan synthase alpha chain
MRENRLESGIRDAQKKGKKIFCAFLTAGYPAIEKTRRMVLEFERAGVDVIELGFLFSDPLADGPTIQYSSQFALERGVSPKDVLRLARDLRRTGVKIPMVVFSYLNPVFRYGVEAFMRDAGKAGFDGVIIPDLPPEGEPSLNRACRKYGLKQIFLVAPTTPGKRAIFLARKSQGFVYYVSTRGVTGARKSVPADIRTAVGEIHRRTGKSVLIGFGVSSPEQAKQLSGMSQGVIVGSAIIDRIRRANGKIEPAVRYVKSMVRAVRRTV